MSDMPTLQERVELLESQVAALQNQLRSGVGEKKDWRRAVAKYAGDDDLCQVLDDAIKLRKADRKRSAATNGNDSGSES